MVEKEEEAKDVLIADSLLFSMENADRVVLLTSRKARIGLAD